MARPEPALLDAARYPWKHTITSRFADMDPNRHFNNVALAAMFEDARVRFNMEARVAGAMEGLRPMVASVSIEYLAQGFYPHPVDAVVATEGFGRSSWSVVQLLSQDAKVIGFARTVIVATDGERSCPVPDSFREALAQWMLR